MNAQTIIFTQVGDIICPGSQWVASIEDFHHVHRVQLRVDGAWHYVCACHTQKDAERMRDSMAYLLRTGQSFDAKGYAEVNGIKLNTESPLP